MEHDTDNSKKKLITFKDMMAIDPSMGSWSDPEGLLAYQMHKRHLESESVADPLAATKLKERQKWSQKKKK